MLSYLPLLIAVNNWHAYLEKSFFAVKSDSVNPFLYKNHLADFIGNLEILFVDRGRGELNILPVMHENRYFRNAEIFLTGPKNEVFEVSFGRELKTIIQLVSQQVRDRI